jgi:hypothetical protein
MRFFSIVGGKNDKPQNDQKAFFYCRRPGNYK